MTSDTDEETVTVARSLPFRGDSELVELFPARVDIECGKRELINCFFVLVFRIPPIPMLF